MGGAAAAQGASWTLELLLQAAARLAALAQQHDADALTEAAAFLSRVFELRLDAIAAAAACMDAAAGSSSSALERLWSSIATAPLHCSAVALAITSAFARLTDALCARCLVAGQPLTAAASQARAVFALIEFAVRWQQGVMPGVALVGQEVLGAAAARLTWALAELELTLENWSAAEQLLGMIAASVSPSTDEHFTVACKQLQCHAPMRAPDELAAEVRALLDHGCCGGEGTERIALLCAQAAVAHQVRHRSLRRVPGARSPRRAALGPMVLHAVHNRRDLAARSQGHGRFVFDPFANVLRRTCMLPHWAPVFEAMLRAGGLAELEDWIAGAS